MGNAVSSGRVYACRHFLREEKHKGSWVPETLEGAALSVSRYPLLVNCVAGGQNQAAEGWAILWNTAGASFWTQFCSVKGEMVAMLPVKRASRRRCFLPGDRLLPCPQGTPAGVPLQRSQENQRGHTTSHLGTHSSHTNNTLFRLTKSVRTQKRKGKKTKPDCCQLSIPTSIWQLLSTSVCDSSIRSIQTRLLNTGVGTLSHWQITAGNEKTKIKSFQNHRQSALSRGLRASSPHVTIRPDLSKGTELDNGSSHTTWKL